MNQVLLIYLHLGELVLGLGLECLQLAHLCSRAHLHLVQFGLQLLDLGLQFLNDILLRLLDALVFGGELSGQLLLLHL